MTLVCSLVVNRVYACTQSSGLQHLAYDVRRQCGWQFNGWQRANEEVHDTVWHLTKSLVREHIQQTMKALV